VRCVEAQRLKGSCLTFRSSGHPRGQEKVFAIRGFNENKKPTTSKGAIRTGLARSFIGDLPHFQLDLPRCPYRSRSCKEIEQHPHFYHR
jgi:hypothetical protein